MEIEDIQKTNDRYGNDKWYFKIKNGRGQTYACAITISKNKIIKKTCSCAFGTWEISRQVKTYKDCRHVKFALQYLENNTFPHPKG